MSKEGEFKRRIYAYHDGNEDTTIPQERVSEMLEEATRDYPSLTSLGLTPQLDKADLDKLLIARNKWFIKWFLDASL
jgi:hypothetical protein